jgi:preprotein translocase subunit SecA
MYEKLAGMTGTASTEAEEFEKIYKMEVVVVPTNRPIARIDYPDYIYKNERAKLEAIGREIEKIHATGQPILVGTRDIEHNELLSRLLKHKGIKHEVLNAKNHFREAQIIARAGERGSVTIATNMAGRGVDIALGGAQPQKTEELTPEQYQEKLTAWEQRNAEVKALGGLYVIGTERHESRRIDNQLRGRSGRQGDPGATRFFVALSDEIIRVFGGDRIAGLMTLLKMPENIPIEHAMVSKAIENAQSKVEGFYFDMRKSVVEYDDVMNKQRDILYKLRRSILEMQYTAGTVHPLKQKLFTKIQERIRRIINADSGEQLTDEQYNRWMYSLAEMIPIDEAAQNHIKAKLVADGTYDGAIEILSQMISEIYTSREQQFGQESIFQMEKNIYLNVIDELWMNHLDNMQTLREGISLRAYGQRDPLIEYKSESFKLFQKLLQDIDYNLINRIFRSLPSNAYELFMNQMLAQAHEQGPDQNASSSAAITAEAQSETPTASAPSIQSSIDKLIAQSPKGPGERNVKIGRNDPCWCGSGKKWKKCHYPASS